jgi:hypothetical protein
MGCNSRKEFVFGRSQNSNQTDRIAEKSKTDKSIRIEVCFGGKVLTDEKLPPLFLGQFSF